MKMSRESTDRNPSPPSEEFQATNRDLLRGDSIGDTVFSKHWVFTTLMKLLKAVENESSSKDEGAGKDEEEKEAANLCGIEIDSDLENDLCKLWDMTANEDVALFLEEWKSPDILLSVIEKTNAPRVTEICMGILGNMVCTSSISKSLSEKPELVALTLSMLSGRDPPTLVETCRFLNTALSHPESSSQWLSSIKEDEEVFQNLAFILQSSTNVELSLVYHLHRSKRRDTVSVILHVLQLISTTSLGVDCLVKMNETVLPILVQYVTDVCEEEVIVIVGQEKVLASCVIVVNILLSAQESIYDLFSSGKELFRNLLKILRVAQKNCSKTRKKTAKSSESAKNSHSTNSEGTSTSSGTQSNTEESKDTKDSGSSHDAPVTDETVEDTTTELLVASLISFAQMLLDASEKSDELKEDLQDKFEEGTDSTWLETLRELVDST
ncbi:Protein SAAL1 [Holothuria leucospilota]|uniref:Protein SAAL1 n=1 Tax=Holothuria leucospilota TaxID=206669 RepID=A0A9Q0YME0_HOLLE|nr:Protein SAAL1 [Holothuria leucospilota]